MVKDNSDSLVTIQRDDLLKLLDDIRSKCDKFISRTKNDNINTWASIHESSATLTIDFIDYIKKTLKLNFATTEIKKSDHTLLRNFLSSSEYRYLPEVNQTVNSVIMTIDPNVALNSIYNDIYAKIQLNRYEVTIDEISNIKNKILASETEIKKLVEDAKLLNTKHALKGFNDLYKKESVEKNNTSLIWLCFAFLFILFLLISIVVCFYFNVTTLTESNKSLFIFANEITFNLILLSISLWCARMYSINKALAINYKHKSVSADALMSYMAAVKNDDITKNTILLESSRMIFSLPEAGLTNKENRLDIKLLETIRDINPTKRE